jgi:hypothetical protein
MLNDHPSRRCVSRSLAMMNMIDTNVGLESLVVASEPASVHFASGYPQALKGVAVVKVQPRATRTDTGGDRRATADQSEVPDGDRFAPKRCAHG